MFEIDLKWVKFLSTLLTLKHFNGTGMSVLLDSLQTSLCTESRWVNNVKMKIQTSFSLFSVHKGHVGHEPRYHPLEPAKQGFPGRNMKPREQSRKGQNPMLLGIAILLESSSMMYQNVPGLQKKMPKNALMYELFIRKV